MLDSLSLSLYHLSKHITGFVTNPASVTRIGEEQGMKKKLLNLKNIGLIAFMAVAALFGVTSVVVNNQVNENPVVEKTEATSDDYLAYVRIYFAGIDGWSLLNYPYYKIGSAGTAYHSTLSASGTPELTAPFNSSNGKYVCDFPITEATSQTGVYGIFRNNDTGNQNFRHYKPHYSDWYDSPYYFVFNPGYIVQITYTSTQRYQGDKDDSAWYDYNISNIGYFVHYAYNSGSASGSNKPNQEVTSSTWSPQAAPTRTGYRFTGWLRSDTQTVVQPTDTLSKPSGPIQLTAQWTKETYTVDAAAGRGVDSVYLSTSNSATSGSEPGSKFEYQANVKCFAVLKSGYVAPDAWVLVSGTRDTEGSKYRVGSHTMAADSYDFGTIDAIPNEFKLVGKGDFMSNGKKWDYDYGMEMSLEDGSSYYASIKNVYFDANSVFQVYDSADEKHGYNDSLNSLLVHQAKYNLITLIDEGSTDVWEGWYYELGNLPESDGSIGCGEINPSGQNYTVYWRTTDRWNTWVNSNVGQGLYVNWESGSWQWKGVDKVSSSDNYLYKNHDTFVENTTLKGFDVCVSLSGGGNAGSKYVNRDNVFNGNIVVKSAGFYNVYVDNTGKVVIEKSNTFSPGESLYLKIGSSGWDTANPMYCAHFWNSGEGESPSDCVNIWGVNVKGDSATDIWEFPIRATASHGNPDRVIFCRCNSTGSSDSSVDNWNLGKGPDGKYHATWNYSATLWSVDDGVIYNVYQVTSTASPSTGAWYDTLTPFERANDFGNYFLSQTGTQCASYDTNTAASFTTIWSNTSSQFDSMNSRAQTYFVSADGSETGEYDINKAAIRYDYIIKKYPSLSDYAGRLDGGHYTFLAVGSFSQYSIFGGSEETMSMTIIIVASSVSLVSVAVLSALIVTKRKRKEE